MSYTATAALPYPDLDRAVNALRGQLREILATQDKVADWSTLEVIGPTEVVGASGRVWYRWAATVGGK
ncbi:hypothetical protein [Geodermatophilus amargosae]|uniref:hypothetical protein n=1 Tax=Geodermatophilus amargosae TaxID=1296565 RepID=UPI0034DE5731